MRSGRHVRLGVLVSGVAMALGVALVPSSARAAPPCEIPPDAYLRLKDDPEVAAALDALSAQYEGPERAGPEYAEARWRAVERAGYRYDCRRGRFVARPASGSTPTTKASPGEDDAAGEGVDPTTSTTSATTSTSLVRRYESPASVRADRRDTQTTELLLGAALGVLALAAALGIGRR